MDSSFAQRSGQLAEFCKVRHWAVRAFNSVFPLKQSTSFPLFVWATSIEALNLQCFQLASSLCLFILLRERRVTIAAEMSYSGSVNAPQLAAELVTPLRSNL